MKTHGKVESKSHNPEGAGYIQDKKSPTSYRISDSIL
jgi:hypothetical protein